MAGRGFVILTVWVMLCNGQIQPNSPPGGDLGVRNTSANGDSGGGDGALVREEKLRTALIDAFHTIKRGTKGGLEQEDPLNSDLTGSVSQLGQREHTGSARSLFQRTDVPTTEDSFDRFFADDDGLSFAEAFDVVTKNDEQQTHSTEKSHNVQHIVKTTKRPEQLRSTGKPAETLIGRISDSIRSAVNETRSVLAVKPSPAPALGRAGPAGMDALLRLFDGEMLSRQWATLQTGVRGPCRAQLALYVAALAEHRLWAMKMDDASGRYTTSFYWGNNYWTGSSELCSALNQQHVASVSASDNNTAVSQIFSEWRDDSSLSEPGPPFDTAFYTLRLRVHATLPSLIKKRRTLHVGLCLPSLCSPQDVGALVAHTRAPTLNATVLAVRSAQHSGYNYLHDTTFQLLVGVSCVVAVLLVSATAYDMRLALRVRRSRQRAANMASARAHSAASPAPDHKLDLTALDNVSMTKGKSIYNVNNNVTINSNNSEERLTADSVSTSDAEDLKLSVWSQLLLSFSMKANILQILDQTVGSDTVPVVHGLRSLSMVWVIFGHTCIVVFKYADNTALRAMLEKSFWFQLILSAVYCVDTFFCLGGMLVTFLYFRTKAKGKLDLLTKGQNKITSGILEFLGLIGYRFARLTAPYLFMLGVVEVTMKWFHYNSVFEPPTDDHENCPNYWWRNILYINTLFPVDQMCMLWSWYLSDDTQFYAVSAILLILATSHFKLAAVSTVVFFLSSLVTTGYVSWSANHIPNTEDPFTQFDKIYDKPWTRLGPYIVGMVTGWILFKTNLRIRMGRIWASVGWAACAGTLLFLIFGLYNTELGVASAAVYSALSHSLWAACVGWVIIACSTGYGGWVRAILSAPVLYPFSRVTYCAYLVHPVVLRYVAMHLTHPLHLGEIFVFILFLGLTVISFALAFVISVAFEAPMVTMLKIISPQRKPHRV